MPMSSVATKEGGHRLAAAFDTVSALPALAESRRRLLAATNGAAASGDELANTIESDAGLAIQVMRAANNGGGPHGRTRGIREAVDVLSLERLRSIAERVETYDPFERPGSLSEQHERFRRHAVATRYAADRIAEIARLADRDELAVAALLHDVGRLVLADLHSAYTDMARRRTSGSAVSGASSASTMRSWAPSWCVAGRSHRTWPPRSSGITRRRPAATRRRSGWPTWWCTTPAAIR
jgi:HD-like signal output (HDOD) protein